MFMSRKPTARNSLPPLPASKPAIPNRSSSAPTKHDWEHGQNASSTVQSDRHSPNSLLTGHGSASSSPAHAAKGSPGTWLYFLPSGCIEQSAPPPTLAVVHQPASSVKDYRIIYKVSSDEFEEQDMRIRWTGPERIFATPPNYAIRVGQLSSTLILDDNLRETLRGSSSVEEAYKRLTGYIEKRPTMSMKELSYEATKWFGPYSKMPSCNFDMTLPTMGMDGKPLATHDGFAILQWRKSP